LPALEVYVLGTFRVQVHGRELGDNDWPRNKARQLLKYLLTQPGRRLLRDQAIDVLWPESQAGAGAASLRTTLSALRRALEPAHVVQSDRHTVHLESGDAVWVDADVFEALAQRALNAAPADSESLLQQASALYGGAYLPDDLYEDWTAERREQLGRIWTDLQLTLARTEEQSGDADAAIVQLERLLRTDPCHEVAAQQLMRLLTRIGRRLEALRAYQRLVEALRDELDVDPSIATMRLHEDIADDTGEKQLPPSTGWSSVGVWRPPTSLPTGTLTFLLTDVEGSARLWEAEPERMRQALVRHDTIVAEVVNEHGGILVRPRGEGDSRFAVFRVATQAVIAAYALQVAFADEQWPTSAPIRVRIALNTGEADLRDGDYYGTTVNRCARLRSIACGGQILVSGVTAELVDEMLTGSIGLRNLGPYRLKDLSRPERVFQVTAPGLQSEFPAPPALDRYPHNLPVQLAPLIGREAELVRLRSTLTASGARLVTLAGPGGVGKTRLAIEAGAELVESFPDGVFLVSLASATEADQVVPAIAQTLGLTEKGARSYEEELIRFLHPRRTLLILDNIEQVIDAASAVRRVLSASPLVSALVTSRTALRISGEHVLALGPLSLPPAGMDVSASAPQLLDYDSMRLFVERAGEAKGDFELASENAALLVSLCRRLDGIPLAIELAAARVRHMDVRTLLTRLQHGLGVLSGGGRDLPDRQRTLRRTIAWSYQLLQPESQRLFRRIGVVAGGVSLETAELLCGDTDAEVLDLLSDLVEINLLRRDETEKLTSRYAMLETVREYALECLQEAGESDMTMRRCADVFVDFAEHWVSRLDTPDQAEWLGWFEREYENFRLCLNWLRGQPDATSGLRLAAALWPFWRVRGHLTEGRVWLDHFLTANAGSTSLIYARALEGAGILAYTQDDYQHASEYHAQSLQIRTAAHDELSAASSRYYLGNIDLEHGKYPEAAISFAESLRLRRHHADTRGVAACLSSLGIIAWFQDNPDAAQQQLHESLRIRRRLSDHYGVALTLRNLADVTSSAGDLDLASAYISESLEIRGKLHDAAGLAHTMLSAGDIARRRGDVRTALMYYYPSLHLGADMSNRAVVARCLDRIAGVALAQSPAGLESAVQLFGAAAAIRESIGSVLHPHEMRVASYDIVDARAKLGDLAFEHAWATGGELASRDVLDIAGRLSIATLGLTPFGIENRFADQDPLDAGDAREGLLRSIPNLMPENVAAYLHDFGLSVHVSSRPGAAM
jgi:predicted ATPase/DNA-binding SARP family transcriptional activator